jgi:hypothetical protein
MEEALFSTVYRGLPVVGGRPLPRHIMPWPRRGVRGPRYLSARARAFEPSESFEGKFRRCITGFIVRSGNP